jgi:hypothetical protein
VIRTTGAVLQGVLVAASNRARHTILVPGSLELA